MVAMPAEVQESIQAFVESQRTSLTTPYYLIDETRLVENLEQAASLRARTGTKSVLALKCFSTWSVFDLMREYLDGTTASSLYEARLGAEKFGKEVHAYSVAFTAEEIAAVRPLATKVIFNSVTQLERCRTHLPGLPIGLRVNAGISYSHFDLADPGRPHSRLGASDQRDLLRVAKGLSGVMFHCNCENADVEVLRTILEHISRTFGPLLHDMEWVSLGGGISFTADGYPFDRFCEILGDFAARFAVQVYLEPGSALVARSGYLVTQVLDIVHNGIDVAIVDSALEAHMLDFLTYRMDAKIDGVPASTGRRYMVAGRSCLAGDVFGTYTFPADLREGSLIAFADAADYTIVKKNWFNGLSMPSIVIRRLDGTVDVVRTFGYDDFVKSLS
jgi:carboxynorspermidine decarboxylase